MLHSAIIMMTLGAVVAPTTQDSSHDQDFLERCRIVATRPSAGELDLVDPEGESRTVREGETLSEAGGVRIKDVRRSSVVLTRIVEGDDGLSGEGLIVVRFDRSGKTKVREYRTVPDGP